jgi:two-component system OmpR family response regulator
MTAAEGSYRMRVHDLEIDWFRRTVRRAGRDVRLTPREFALLQLFVTHRGRVLTRSAICEHLYGELRQKSNVVDVYVRHLREKLEKAADTPLILTHRGAGYLFRAEDCPAGADDGRGDNWPADLFGPHSRA